MSAEDQLADLLLAWEEAQEHGQPISAEELCRDCPALLAALREHIERLQRANWMQPVVPAHSQSPRTLAGRYVLEQLLGAGGYAQVWRAYDMQLHRHVAVKVPRPNRTMVSAQIEQVLDEARQWRG